MRITLHFLILILFIQTTACSHDSIERTNLEAKQINDVAYGSSPLQKFDVYLPQGRNNSTKTILFLHGGGWRDEDKSQYAPLLSYFVDRGFAVVNANYRLAKDAEDKFPVQEVDIQLIINAILDNKEEYVISDKIALAGNSAGAHLALLFAYGYDVERRISAVAAQSAPTDFVAAANSGNMQAINTIQYFLGKSYSQDPALWEGASPYWRATTQAPPTILFVGGLDEIVAPGQSVSLKQKLDDLSVANRLITYPNEGHAWVGANLDDTRSKIVDWFNAYME